MKKRKPSKAFIDLLLKRIDEIKPRVEKAASSITTDCKTINFPFEFRGIVSNMLVWDVEQKKIVRVTFPYWVTDTEYETLAIEL